MVNPRSKTAGRKDRGSREPGAPPVVPPPPPPPPQEVPTCPGTQHGSSDMLLNILLGMQQQQQQQQQQMALLQQQMAAQQQQIELQQQQQQQARPLNYFLELKEAHAPTFGGSTDPLEAKKWITEMEKFCRALCIPKDEWVNVTIPFLIADAEAWFISVKPAYESGGRRIDWAQFQDIFYLNYFPANFRIEKENEFFNLKQGSMTVIQYASMFNQLGRFAPAFMVHERNKVTRFEEGLNLNLRVCMGTAQATTYQDLLEQATRAERLITERNQIRDSKRPRPWNEQDEETESAANKKATSANKKAIQEVLDGSTVHGQDDEISAENSSLPAAHEEQRKVDEKISAENSSLPAASEEQRRVDEKISAENSSLPAASEEQRKVDEKISAENSSLPAASEEQRKVDEKISTENSSLPAASEEQRKVDEKISTENSSLPAASEEQRKVDEKVMRLAEEQKKQIEALHKRIIQLEKDLDQKHALQLDVERLRGQLNVLKKAKEAELKDQANLNQSRIVNDELQDARKELINGLIEFPIPSSIGIKRIKRIVELDNKPFIEAMKREYKDEAEAEETALELCSLWEEYLKDPGWHPTNFFVNGKPEGVFSEGYYDRLEYLKVKYGDAVYNAVRTALHEINDYNPSRRYSVPELWNYAEGRRATLKEGVDVLLRKWRTLLDEAKCD